MCKASYGLSVSKVHEFRRFRHHAYCFLASSVSDVVSGDIHRAVVSARVS